MDQVKTGYSNETEDINKTKNYRFRQICYTLATSVHCFFGLMPFPVTEELVTATNHLELLDCASCRQF